MVIEVKGETIMPVSGKEKNGPDGQKTPLRPTQIKNTEKQKQIKTKDKNRERKGNVRPRERSGMKIKKFAKNVALWARITKKSD